MIALALQECDRLGIRRVLMCCDRDNVALARTIQKTAAFWKTKLTMTAYLCSATGLSAKTKPQTFIRTQECLRFLICR